MSGSRGRGHKPKKQGDGLDTRTVAGFGGEWRVFDQSRLPEELLRSTFDEYFSEFPWTTLPDAAVGIDVGCGSGRWARFAALHARLLVCIEPSSEAMEVASRVTEDVPQIVAVRGAATTLPLRIESADFGYALGVLHHTPNPAGALRDCVQCLKVGSPFLVYIYYALDGRPRWFRMLWRTCDFVRRAISRSPFRARYWATQIIATFVYWPIARLGRIAQSCGVNTERWPLAYYRNRPFYVMRNDALDRFGTRLEWRFSRTEIEYMMNDAGLGQVRFRESPPFWCAVGRREF